MVEIEAKVKVESLGGVVEQLKAAHARFTCRLVQKDTFFDSTGKTLLKSGRGLRLRREKTDDSEKVILTYKGAKQASKFKLRTETEVVVADFADMAEMLKELGYKQILAFEKERDIWCIGNCQVCLDKLPLLGCFVEVEGPSEEEITDVLQKLGLAHLPHINTGYARLMRNKLDEIGSDKKKVSFN